MARVFGQTQCNCYMSACQLWPFRTGSSIEWTVDSCTNFAPQKEIYVYVWEWVIPGTYRRLYTFGTFPDLGLKAADTSDPNLLTSAADHLKTRVRGPRLIASIPRLSLRLTLYHLDTSLECLSRPEWGIRYNLITSISMSTNPCTSSSLLVCSSHTIERFARVVASAR